MGGRGIACAAAVGFGALLLSCGPALGREFIAPLVHGGDTAAANSVAISPDGASVYVAGLDEKLRGGVTAFARNPATGGLTRLSCIRAGGELGCKRPRGGFEGARDTALAVSGDGRFVALVSAHRAYASGDPARLTTYHRDPQTGSLTFAGCASDPPAPAGCTPSSHIGGATDVTFGPASATLYVLGQGATPTELEPSEGGIAIFALDASGVPTQTGCVTERGADGECIDGIGLDAPRDFSLSRDGRTLDVVGDTIGLASFTVSQDDGALSPAGCLSPRGVSGTGSPHACRPGFDESVQIARGPGGEALVTTLEGIHTIAIPGSGQPRAERCDAILRPACGRPTYVPPLAIDTTVDGRRAFVSSYESSYRDLLFLLAKPRGGRLHKTGCIAHDLRGALGLGCNTGLREITDLAASPDGESVYTVTGNTPLRGLASYGLAAGVVSARATGRGATRVVRVHCSTARRRCRGRVELRLLAHRRVRGRREQELGNLLGTARYGAAPGETLAVTIRLRRPLDGRLRVAVARATDSTGTTRPSVTRVKVR